MYRRISFPSPLLISILSTLRPPPTPSQGTGHITRPNTRRRQRPRNGGSTAQTNQPHASLLPTNPTLLPLTVRPRRRIPILGRQLRRRRRRRRKRRRRKRGHPRAHLIVEDREGADDPLPPPAHAQAGVDPRVGVAARDAEGEGGARVRRRHGELLQEGGPQRRGVLRVHGGRRRGLHGHEEERVQPLRDGGAVVRAVCLLVWVGVVWWVLGKLMGWMGWMPSGWARALYI